MKMGIINWRDSLEDTHSSFDVKHIFVHEDYINSSHAHDIALLKLKGTARNHENIDCISLPPRNIKKRLEGEKAVVSGWGETRSRHGKLYKPERLREVRVEIYSQTTCEEDWLASEGESYPLMLCAGDAERNFCNGDSGGPMSVQLGDDATDRILVGVVSNNDDDCREIGHYMSVSDYLDWIGKKL